MSNTWLQIKGLIANGEIKISAHGYDELADDNIFAKDTMIGIATAIVVEDYPTFHKGPAVLILQLDRNSQPIHIVWGIPFGKTSPAVLVTAYRPDPTRWSSNFTRRIV